MIENNNFGTKQENENAAYWHQRNDNDGYINFQKYTNQEIKEEKVSISKAEISKINIKGTPGKVLYLNNEGPYVICKDGALKILDYNFENDKKRVISRKDYFS